MRDALGKANPRLLKPVVIEEIDSEGLPSCSIPLSGREPIWNDRPGVPRAIKAIYSHCRSGGKAKDRRWTVAVRDNGGGYGSRPRRPYLLKSTGQRKVFRDVQIVQSVFGLRTIPG